MDINITPPSSPEGPFQIEIKMAAAELKEQFETNFQHGGMFIMIAEDMKMYAKVNVKLTPSGAADSFELSGEVVHVASGAPGSPKGVSIQFLNFSPAQKDQLKEFAESAVDTAPPELEPEPVEEVEETPIEEPIVEEAEEEETSEPEAEVEEEEFPEDEPSGEEEIPPEIDDDEGPSVEDVPDDGNSKVIEQMVHQMGYGRRRELALTGNRKQRLILLRMSGVKIVPDLLQNPDLSGFEMGEILKLPKLPHTIVEEIAADEKWNRIDSVRLGLFLNPHTPVSIARKYLPYINTKNLVQIQKQKKVKGELKRMVDRMVATRLKKEPKAKWNK